MEFNIGFYGLLEWAFALGFLFLCMSGFLALIESSIGVVKYIFQNIKKAYTWIKTNGKYNW